jgi:CheY-like chemotaxis protein
MVLVAEDHQINVHLILAVLEAAGCETELAANGRQALAKLDKANPRSARTHVAPELGG